MLVVRVDAMTFVWKFIIFPEELWRYLHTHNRDKDNLKTFANWLQHLISSFDKKTKKEGQPEDIVIKMYAAAAVSALASPCRASQEEMQDKKARVECCP